MILPPSSGGQASVVYTYTVSGLGNPQGMTFDGTHIHIAIHGRQCSDDSPAVISGWSSVYRPHLYRRVD